MIGIPFLWLAVFFAPPFVLVLKISFADQKMGIPPYTSLVKFENGMVQFAMQLSPYAFLLQDDLYIATYISSLKMAAVSSFFCLLIGYPVAYYIARSEPSRRNMLMIGRVMWDEFFNNMDWPMASAVTVAMVLLLLVPMAVFQYYQVKDLEAGK